MCVESKAIVRQSHVFFFRPDKWDIKSIKHITKINNFRKLRGTISCESILVYMGHAYRLMRNVIHARNEKQINKIRNSEIISRVLAYYVYPKIDSYHVYR